MEFSKILTGYCKYLGCSNVRLAEAAGVDVSIISRFKNGKRVPKKDSQVIKQLADGIEEIAKEEGNIDITNVYSKFYNVLSENEKESYQYKQNITKCFNIIFDKLSVKSAFIAKYLNMDQASISRIRNGQRLPADIDEYIVKICHMLIRDYRQSDCIDIYTQVFGTDCTNITEEKLNKLIRKYSCRNEDNHMCSNDNKGVVQFLGKLDEFDLNKYISLISFKDMNNPDDIIDDASNNRYIGLEQARKATLDFTKEVLKSNNCKEIICYSEMDVKNFAKDLDYARKWMYGLAMLVKKGCIINQIHYLDRSLEEMMIGLESWIPLYMTGSIKPYYIKDKTRVLFTNTLFVCENAVALHGLCLQHDEQNANCYLTTEKSEVKNYTATAQKLKSIASPLMKIYKKEQFKEYVADMEESISNVHKVERIMHEPSIHTISEKLLRKILLRNSISSSRIEEIVNIVKEYKAKSVYREDKDKVVSLCERYPIYTHKDFEKEAIRVSLLPLNITEEIYYTYDEYMEHLKNAPNEVPDYVHYTYKRMEKTWFKNIVISIYYDRCVEVTKVNNPVVHFIIKHKKLCEAFENIDLTIEI